MRVALSNINPVKECQTCIDREEREVSSHILSYQIAHQLLKSVPGQIQVDGNRLILNLEAFEPFHFDLKSGTLNTRALSIPLEQRYQSDKSLDSLCRQIKDELQIKALEDRQVDHIHTLLVKLVEIFHARCGLYVQSVRAEGDKTLWEIRLGEEGPSGWIQNDGLLRNRFGEEINIDSWGQLRPEKLASYVFGFNRFCRHYTLPRK
jgi:hypothetical protein